MRVIGRRRKAQMSIYKKFAQILNGENSILRGVLEDMLEKESIRENERAWEDCVKFPVKIELCRVKVTIDGEEHNAPMYYREQVDTAIKWREVFREELF